ncbi:cation transporter [Zunongwangia sp. F363]|uniref:Cation transporter n=1 Tax=Autumnicola tepida TaxID=3075595 RepID=A0ABU3C8I8_9FLAO|nr:cation transporter [Zunongwangia sp. F363]MDT0642660.1 cation transporter [Zunongwangia sp. F363]
MENQDKEKVQKGLHYAMILSVITIAYNTIEGIVSTFFGASDETLALFGFGLDSFVEVLSGVGIAHMIYRMKRNSINERDKFEITALRITGTALYILTAGLIVGAGISIFNQSEPETTMAGIIVAGISILTMYFLYAEKMKVGKKLDSKPIISDAKCTKTCFYLSFILLASSLIYEIWQIPYIDALGSIGIAWYAWKEGKEAFENAKSKSLSCSSDCC